MTKTLNLELHPSSVKLGTEEYPRQYLIVNSADYYNQVVGTFAEDGKFLYFQGWDNGEYVTFKPKDYAYWAVLPAKKPE
ncbi:hypothetical protein QE197_04715 [Arsenophonus nasoniae]|uniref:DUF551 domain-containing protein n=1 Tax=Arsenophonus nasoniae TaxID=638 RepID=D2U0A6_9GAMM|nr:hypothetical protein [Arsenophonus nasoniae]QBY42607.1 hypothetical protein ArsFIN_11650 [Arsenophonus nasoniae]WGM06700.1 hypothetical protein QE258_05165 [Arsenophonus nasoniae]WGM11644.1 hypothetical protein QE197_04715 [Arsenophonus nasoniae]WGM16334.1 hypothetical protein QE193_04670 [Arsenophonus nasoniae]CBA73709.1 hypothetical protein ARN_19190 [Arsenophonus nasoniae]